MTVTPIPIDKFILFLDELIKEFFNHDYMQYSMFGKVAAKFALSPDGPYKSYMLSKDIKPFVELILPKLYSTYFDKGEVTARLEDNVAHITVKGLPLKHNYFEYLLMGYFQKALGILGKKGVCNRTKSLASGDDQIYCTYTLTNF